MRGKAGQSSTQGKLSGCWFLVPKVETTRYEGGGRQRHCVALQCGLLPICPSMPPVLRRGSPQAGLCKPRAAAVRTSGPSVLTRPFPPAVILAHMHEKLQVPSIRFGCQILMNMLPRIASNMVPSLTGGDPRFDKESEPLHKIRSLPDSSPSTSSPTPISISSRRVATSLGVEARQVDDRPRPL